MCQILGASGDERVVLPCGEIDLRTKDGVGFGAQRQFPGKGSAQANRTLNSNVCVMVGCDPCGKCESQS